MSRYATNKMSPNGSGQPIATFAGIDYSKRFSYITIGDQDGKVLLSISEEQFSKFQKSSSATHDYEARIHEFPATSTTAYEQTLGDGIPRCTTTDPVATASAVIS